jgi:hypothetical protein
MAYFHRRTCLKMAADRAPYWQLHRYVEYRQRQVQNPSPEACLLSDRASLIVHQQLLQCSSAAASSVLLRWQSVSGRAQSRMFTQRSSVNDLYSSKVQLPCCACPVGSTSMPTHDTSMLHTTLHQH